MNIYLDIDGVLLINENHAAPHADDFLQHVLKKYPNSTYWLTTHNWHGENRAIKVLAPKLKPETIKLLSNIKPSEWGELKTDAIDFEQDFLWFDDDIWSDEMQVLQANNAFGRFIMVDLQKDPDMLKKLIDVL